MKGVMLKPRQNFAGQTHSNYHDNNGSLWNRSVSLSAKKK